MSDIGTDLNATIAYAVKAKIEAAVTAALATDEVLGGYVAAALNQEVTVKDGFRDRKTTYLRHTIDNAIREATKTAVHRILEEETALITEEVRKAFRREAGTLAAGLVGSLVEKCKNNYGVDVTLKLPGDRY